MRRSGKDWFRNEAEVMNILGLEQVPGSGSSWIAREDGENDNVLCQLKSTDAQSIRVQLQDIHELQVHALTSHKIPVFAIQFRDSNEVFLLVSPVQLQEVAEYLVDPRKKPEKTEILGDGLGEWEPPEPVGSAKKARERFQRENDKKFEKKEKSAI